MKKKVKSNFEISRNKKSEGTATNFSETIENPKKWYEQFTDDPEQFPPVSEERLAQLKREAKELLDSETLAFNTKNARTNKSSDYEWVKTVLVKGTVSDKIAAYTVLIQDNPVYNLKSIQHLVGMVKVSKKNECLLVMQTLSELFLQDLLRPDEKLKAFHERPLSMLDELTSGNIVARKRRLVLWYFEDQLKETYMTFVQALITAAHDSVDATKEKAINAMSNLLAGNPEQEKLLLTSIVNKLGDPSQKVASKTIYCLGQVLYKHPNMKHVVLMEIEKLLFRSNIPQRAQYYSICFLSQYYLTHDDFEVAKHLITVYFAFFKACVKKDEVDSRMMSALLMGVNRAYPYAKLELSQVSEHIDTLYKVVHQANFNVSLHALNLLFQVCDLSNSVNDRFYSALYKKLMDQNINNTTHQALFLNLIFKALKKDTNKHRVNVFIKRLLQVALNCSVPMACAILYTISQISRFKKHDLLLSHQAVVKQEPEEVEIEEQPHEEGESNTEENIAKMNLDNTSENEGESNEIKEKINTNNLLTVNVGIEDVTPVIKQEQDPENIQLKRNSYNPFHRNPLYAGGQYCVHTELSALQEHFHPTVALFSKNLATGERIVYTGDPLKDFTLIRFLDRFVFKNPKKIDSDKEDKQKYKGYHFKLGQRKDYVPQGLRALPVRSKTYLKEAESKIPVDELFMYRFLQKKMQNQLEKDENDEEADSDLESVESDLFNEMLDKMMGSKKRKAEDEDDDINYMNELGDSLKVKKTKTGKNESDEEESEDEEELEMGEDEGSEDEIETEDFEDGDNNEDNDEDEDIEMESGDEELIGDLDDDLSEMEFDESDEVGEEQNYKSMAKKMKKKFSKNTGDISSAFASAEEFSMMLENAGASKFKSGSAHAMSNKDKADEKQIDWEQKRNQWISGYRMATSGKKKFANKKSGGKVKEKKKHLKNNRKKIKKNKK